MQRFQNRHEAGREVAKRLSKYGEWSDAIILALPRGGVPVAYEVALALKIPLDVLIVRKLGLPGQEELAVGAVASGGIRILNEDIVHALRINPSVIDRITQQALGELQQREVSYRGDGPAPNLHGRTVILIDDGLATGASMLAAVRAIRTNGPARIVVAVPAAAPQSIDLLRPEVDEIIVVLSPDPFEGVGKWYEDFSQTTDEEVRFLLNDAGNRLVP